MNAEEVAFARQQRALCLKDAGLPVPVLAPSPVLAMPFLSPAHVPTRPISPAEADCGPRALSLLCQKMGVKASLPQLRQWAGTTVQGTSMAGLAQAAQAAGLKTEGMQVSREALPDQDMPAIAYVNNNHFVAVLSVAGSGDSGTAVIHDPNSAGEETIPQERLLRLCSGYLLLVRR